MRDHTFEDQALADASWLCERVCSRRAPFYARAVRERLAMGEHRYGPENYLRIDGLTEASEETSDLGAYLLLELQKLRPLMRDEDFQEFRQRTLDAIAHTAAAHEALGELRRMRSEFIP